ncbi:hydroxymethylpyrimidine kinase/phosphomethylpyrimidine kinase [Palleronia marisminoris]|uniref:hydroxymethylpyrimidine kinase n=1 Tax=Palleronia marisminoris TaxID=315423 RepID=A0A1Y5SBU4_9RHOB|nr:bifunctional hydroxymethylpyrimidine kinase/phosphomethylpyrimidine kinase [Palleronia marisminoris]SFG72801.1 hydroxymethylpyrimidine kinase/phosphomethylpyrimidine kinase [Palleronia marisminoris]SLN37196.1 Hydroxymethylpyrimidine/phosphomethylpyrimidine kinase [Palleronia marisminoris]
MTPHVSALTIAGSDSGGGAGVQADLKTFSALGVYGTSAITAITAQNTRGVFAVEAVSPAMVSAQIAAVLDDIAPQAIKIGMLASAEIIAAVAAALRGYGGPVVLDPVMVAKSGDPLLAEEAEAALIESLLPRADVLTPNLPEAARLLGRDPARTPEEAEAQGRALLGLGAGAVVMKGGHAAGPTCIDRLVTASGVLAMEQPRLATRNTHGTGCSLSSAIAAALAKGATLEAAVRQAQSWLHGAIRAADGLGIGSGHGPVHHFHEVWT